MKCSVIIPVLDSHDVVRRQLLLFNEIVPEDFEVIIVDDGSEEGLYEYLFHNESDLPYDSESCFLMYDALAGCEVVTIGTMNYPLRIVITDDKQAWSQPRAHNTGAKISHGEYLLFTDIDHIFTKECMQDVANFSGDKMKFPRKYAVLDENGKIVRDKETLMEYGCKEKDLNWGSCHENTFAIRRTIFCDMLGGYDEKFCGKHGGDDTDLSRRYGQLYYAKKAKRHTMGSLIYVFPDPGRDVKSIFHHLRHRK